MAKITTKMGDGGKTRLADGTQVSKSHPFVEAIGEIDELSACLGLVIARPLNGKFKEWLRQIQRDLHIVGGDLATPPPREQVRITPESVRRLERMLDEAEQELPALDSFILPGGDETAALLHVARAVSRRAERAVVGASGEGHVNPEILVYLNRLSDFLFQLARRINANRGQPEERVHS